VALDRSVHEQHRDSTVVSVPVFDTVTNVTVTVPPRDSIIGPRDTVVIPAKDSVVKLHTVSFVTRKYPSIQSVYKSFVGIREATGHNDGPAVELFLRHVGLTKGNPWCAASVRTGYDSAGIRTTINGAAASVDNHRNRALFNGTFLHPIQPGDAFTIYFPSLHRIGHCGFVDHKLNGMTAVTYEGNTNSQNSREGDGFYIRYRPIKSFYTINMWRK
jgi:hypothetical protein